MSNLIKHKIIFPIRIVEHAFYVPEKIIDNNFYAKRFNLEAEWIKRLTGIDYRHQAAEDECCSDLAVESMGVV